MPATIYGTTEETYIRADNGRIYLVQSPDLRPGETHLEVLALPPDAALLPDSATYDLEIPAHLKGDA